MSPGWKVLFASALAASVLIALLATGPETAREVTGGSLILYCAAGAQPPVEAVVAEYRKAYGTEVQVQYGGSGTLLNNLQIAHEGDLYIAADSTQMDLAMSKGLVAEVIPLAHQRPVIGVKKGNPARIASLEDLMRPEVRVAMGNPEAASVGKVTRDVLSAIGKWTALEKHVKETGVFKPTVPDLANDVKIGAVDAGILWDATIAQYPELEAVHVPEFDAAPQLLSIGVLSSCDQPAWALHFARYVAARDRGLPIFRARGFEVVDGDIWAESPEVVLFSGGINRLAIEDTLRAFEAREGVKVITSYNGCGILVGEIKAGKRPDAYFACDSSYMTQVHDLFVDQQDISRTDMVLLTQKGNPKGIRTLEDLARPGVTIAVANEKYSALGLLTRRLLEQTGLLEKVLPNITYADAPTADYLTVRVRVGREDVAIVYRANTVKAKEVEVISIDHPAARAVQPIAVGRESGHRRLVGRLVAALKSAESRRRFESSGFRWAAGQETGPRDE